MIHRSRGTEITPTCLPSGSIATMIIVSVRHVPSLGRLSVPSRTMFNVLGHGIAAAGGGGVGRGVAVAVLVGVAVGPAGVAVTKIGAAVGVGVFNGAGVE